MNTYKHLTPGMVLAGALLLGLPLPDAMARGGIEIGVLSCNSVEGTRRNLLIHSTVDVRCVFKTAEGQESYTGETGIGLGVDLNWNRTETTHFVVLGGTSDARPGAHSLAGTYVGGKVSVTVGVGAGAGALVGGGAKNISLQPLALEGSTGLGVAGGLGYLILKPGR
ncbi:MAG: DUF992 domain-containing protein [Alphaproteobacteria bacterium]|nr:DUF992 domain-containing protein [Alphaproteobacteria bacterium]MCZ6606503.1 DUF992 domain-containing protein [Alphaproteobacteria bacterium]